MFGSNVVGGVYYAVHAGVLGIQLSQEQCQPTQPFRRLSMFLLIQSSYVAPSTLELFEEAD